MNHPVLKVNKVSNTVILRYSRIFYSQFHLFAVTF
jgi:hypothetical protein